MTAIQESFHMLCARENELLEQMQGMEKKVEQLRVQWVALRKRKQELYLQEKLNPSPLSAPPANSVSTTETGLIAVDVDRAA